MAKALAGGSVKVIVHLTAPFTPHGEGHAQSENAQAAAIAVEQDDVVTSVSAHNVRDVKKYGHIPYVAMEVDTAALAALLNNPKVAGVEEDMPTYATLAQSVPLIGATTAWTSGYTGAGYSVAVLDTGVEKTHPFLTGKVIAEACFLSSPSTCPGSLPSLIGVGAAPDGYDHGTHVAGIATGNNGTLFGVAKSASVIAVKILSDSGSGWSSDIILGLDWVYSVRGSYSIAAVNMSLGDGASWSTNCDASAYKAAIDNLRAVNIATVVASGNSGSKTGISSPACVSTAVSVGASNKSDVAASFSQSASILSLMAPGVSINSSVIGGGYAAWNGTSMATPHVAGAWALMKHQLGAGATVSSILSALQSTGTNITDTNGVTKPRINVGLATTPPVPSTMLTPAQGATLTGSSVTFTWSAVAGATGYIVWVGNSLGTYDITSSGTWQTGTSQTLSGVPVDGRTIYVRLCTLINGQYINYHNDYTYTAYSIIPSTMLTPVQGSTLTGSSVTFTWSAVAGATGYIVWVGNSLGTYDITSSGTWQTGTSQTLSGVPVDGRTIYVRLWTLINGQYVNYHNDYTYTAFM